MTKSIANVVMAGIITLSLLGLVVTLISNYFGGTVTSNGLALAIPIILACLALRTKLREQEKERRAQAKGLNHYRTHVHERKLVKKSA